jgi:hypothetical protein
MGDCNERRRQRVHSEQDYRGQRHGESGQLSRQTPLCAAKHQQAMTQSTETMERAEAARAHVQRRVQHASRDRNCTAATGAGNASTIEHSVSGEGELEKEVSKVPRREADTNRRTSERVVSERPEEVEADAAERRHADIHHIATNTPQTPNESTPRTAQQSAAVFAFT